METDKKKWKVLNSEHLIKEPWCTVRKDWVKLPSGTEIPSYYILEYPMWTNILGITKDKQFVFVKQYRHGLRATTYELPAGVCDDTDASFMDAAKRELLEETGYGNGNWSLLTTISANPGTHTNMCYCYLATDIEKVTEPHLENTEDLDVELLSLDQVKQILLNDEIKQAMHVAPLWKYMAINKLM